MKKIVLILMITVLFLLGIQSLYGAKIGVKAGYSLSRMGDEFVQDQTKPGPWDSWIWREMDYDFNFRSSFLVGLFIDIPLSSRLSFQPEILLTQKGVKIIDSSELVTIEQLYTDYELKFHYLEFPALLKLELGRGGSVSPYLLAGPYVALKLSGSFRLNWEFHDLGSGSESGDIETARNVDFGMVVGVGARFKLKKANIYLELRYSQGFSNVMDDVSNYSNGDDFIGKHSALSISLGYSR